MLSSKQQLAISELIQGKSREETAKTCKITTRQLYNYIQNPEFSAELRRRQAALTEQAAAIGRSRTAVAMSVFETVMTDPDVNPQVRIQAARNLLQFALELDERENILTRIEQLEKSINGGENYGNH